MVASHDPCRVNTLVSTPGCSPVESKVRWDPVHSIWNGGMFAAAMTHDMRDWAQRQSDCHDYLAHRRPMLIDAWWQLHCRLQLEIYPLGNPSRSNFPVIAL